MGNLLDLLLHLGWRAAMDLLTPVLADLNILFAAAGGGEGGGGGGIAGTALTLTEVAILGAVIVVASYADFKLFGHKGEPSFRSAVIWSIGWVALAAVAAVVILVDMGSDTALLFSTVYLIERSLSLDNVFVFLLLFTYFSIPQENRAKLIIIGIIFALFVRGLAIIGGIELLERFEFLIYVLAAGLLVLAVRIGAGMDEDMEPGDNIMVRGVRKIFPVKPEGYEGNWFLREDGKLHTTPIFLCFVALVFTDIIFAIDSIPAAFAVTRDSFVIWSANVFALLGLRALIVLVDRLLDKFRYLDETIAVVLGVIAIKLIIEEAGLVEIPPLGSLAIVIVIFAAGIILSIIVGNDEQDGSDLDQAKAEADEAEAPGAEGSSDEQAESSSDGSGSGPEASKADGD